MWPFNKKAKEQEKEPVNNLVQYAANSIFCIPGNWPGFEELHGELLTATGAAYMIVGETLINGQTGRQYRFEMYGAEERMEEAFRTGGQTTGIAEQTLQDIAGHQSVIYLLGETGNLEEAAHFAQVGLTLLNLGGLGIKVESGGKAFSKSAWQEVMSEAPDEDLYNLFVLDSLTTDDGAVYSCGMHNLGYRDTIVSGEDTEEAISLIRIFNYHQIVEPSALKNGQMFRSNTESPLYRITEELNPPYSEGICYNPFGVWRLSRVEQ